VDVQIDGGTETWEREIETDRDVRGIKEIESACMQASDPLVCIIKDLAEKSIEVTS